MWGRSPSVIWGGVLVVLGVLFLLSNLNINIRWDLLWPALIILLGLWLLVARVGPGGNFADVDSAEPRDGISKATLELSVGAGRVDVRSVELGDQLFRTHIEHQGASPEVKLD